MADTHTVATGHLIDRFSYPKYTYLNASGYEIVIKSGPHVHKYAKFDCLLFLLLKTNVDLNVLILTEELILQESGFYPSKY